MAKLRYIALVLAAALLLSGCQFKSASALFCLPEQADPDSNLSDVIREAMEGMEYCAPTSGDHRQSVQTADLNGDDRMEYLVYARSIADNGLRILIFSGDGAEYGLLDTVECSGTAFDRVEYVQMDNAVGCEIVVGRKFADQASGSVTVYSLIVNHVEQFLTTGYTRFITADLNGNGRYELFLLRPGTGSRGVAVVYGMQGRDMIATDEIPMSESAQQIRRITVGTLLDGQAAIYVASAVSDGSGVITDVYQLQADELKNVTLSADSQISEGTLCGSNIFAADIDGDGILELPRLMDMHRTDDAENTDGQYLIRWYALTADGEPVNKLCTYYNVTAGWYMELDSALAHRFTVTQKGSSYAFSLWNEDFTAEQKLMTVFVLTGQRREEQALANNRFVLYRTDAAIYAANLEVASSAYGMTKQLLIGWFHLIQEDGKTGVT